MREELEKILDKYWKDTYDGNKSKMDEAVNAIMELVEKKCLEHGANCIDFAREEHQQQIKELKGILRGKEGYALTDYEKLVAIENKLNELDREIDS